MNDLATMFLQDLAAMLVLYPERDMAALEREFLVMRSQEFQVRSID